MKMKSNNIKPTTRTALLVHTVVFMFEWRLSYKMRRLF